MIIIQNSFYEVLDLSHILFLLQVHSINVTLTLQHLMKSIKTTIEVYEILSYSISRLYKKQTNKQMCKTILKDKKASIKLKFCFHKFMNLLHKHKF